MGEAMSAEELKPTPGPWFVNDGSPASQWIATSAEIEDGGDVICNPPFADEEASLARWPANARLIASAPALAARVAQLTEALEYVRKIAASMVNAPNHSWM